MKIKNIFPAIILSGLLFSACDDQIMEWGKDPSHGDVTESELPLELAEKISRYDALNTYTDFTLGVGAGMDLYMNDETYRNLINENFDEMTVGYAMKHGAMVESDGSIDFEPVDEFMSTITTAGLSVFGHTLVWHSNQNASYLNGLIAATVIPGTAGSNLLSNGDFEEATLAPWNGWGNSSTRAVSADGEGLGDAGYAMVLTNPTAANNYSAQQVYDLSAALESGTEYLCTFWVKADVSAALQVEVQNPSNYSADYYGGISVGTTWSQVELTITPTTDTRTRFIFDFGETAATFYIDDIVLMKKPENLISNGDFEGATLDSWFGWGNSSTRAVSADGEGYGDTGYAMVLTNPTAASNYNAQQAYDFSSALQSGTDYKCTFWVKADVPAALQVEIQDPTNYSANYYGGISVGTSWTYVDLTITPSTDTRTRFLFDFGETAATFYIDDIEFYVDGGGTETTIIEKTNAEKTEIIGTAMADWIEQMVTHYKDQIHAWDVVNEPMKEDGSVRDGEVTDLTDDQFYWVKYLGQDYAVTAFNLARQYGNAGDKLFINDYNLEYNLDKCDGLISYVQYIEAQGAQVDGIGTQMHISINTDTANIIQMFQKLAASGKLIKVSELDITIGTDSPTAAQYAEQADMYQFVIDMYKQYIPDAQRYGITAWGVSDNAKEHEYWLPDDTPNLWDADYERKHAYKGFADGLAGEDVSEGFSGELVY